MDFISFDFETANSQKNSICSLGYCLVKNNEIVEREYFLINPEDVFDFRNIGIHHITPDMVDNSPLFPDIWEKVKGSFENYPLVAHSAKSAEIPMLKGVFKKYGINAKELQIYDTVEISKKNLSLKDNKLETVCEHFNVSLCEHHNSLCDAVATAEIMIHFLNNDFIMSPLKLIDNKVSKIGEQKTSVEKNIPVFGLISPKSYTEFKDDSEKLEYLKSNNIIAPTIKVLRPLFYMGVYSENKRVRCNVVGYEGKSTVVISMDNHLHCVNIENFGEMQPLVGDIPDFMNNNPFYVKYLHGSPLENEILSDIKSLLNPRLLVDSDLRLNINKTEYNSIYIDLKPNAYRVGFEKSSLFMRICDREDSSGYVAFPPKSVSILAKHGFEFSDRTSDGFGKINIYNFAALLKNKNNLISKSLDLIFLSAFEFSAFGCCSRFKECSKEKHCVHPDIIYATACLYKKNLDEGKIFY